MSVTIARTQLQKLLGFLILGLMLTTASGANAQICSFSITNVNFGNIDVTANTTFDTTATFTANCTGMAGRMVRVCPNIGLGTGGSTTGNPRFLLSGPTQLDFNLFSNAARTNVWGSTLWGFPYNPPTVNIRLNGAGIGSATRTIYARVFASQQTKPAGIYTSSFAAPHTAIAYAYAAVGNCNAIGGTNAVAAPFTVIATNVTTCSVTATTVDFGTAGILQTAIDATGTLSVTCTASAPYTIALNGGNDAATDPTQRKMSKGIEKITYGLYRDAARILPWGSTTGVDTVAGTGTGLVQNVTVFGRVAAQPTPSPGIYTDTIVVTLTY